MLISHSVFTDQDFYPALHRDLESARGLVIIQSPFVTVNRLAKMEKAILRCTQRGVTVCAFVQTPDGWHLRDRAAVPHLRVIETALQMLQSLGVHVVMLKLIHAKIVLIDDEIFWDGSLNVLSHYNATERMTRWNSHEKVLEAMRTHAFFEFGPLRGLRTIFDVDRAAERLTTDLAESIRFQRDLGECKQGDMADRCNISRRVMGRIERGAGNPCLETICKVSSTLEMRLLPIPWYLIPSVEALLKRHFHPSPPGQNTPNEGPRSPKSQVRRSPGKADAGVNLSGHISPRNR